MIVLSMECKIIDFAGNGRVVALQNVHPMSVILERRKVCHFLFLHLILLLICGNLSNLWFMPVAKRNFD
jgi:hypothetical protein